MGETLRRRAFTAALALAALAPKWSAAQGTGAMRRLAFLGSIPESDPDMRYRLDIFRRALRELGWEQGRNLQVEYRWEIATRAPAEARAIAAELVATAPDVIVAQGSASARWLLQATRTIPIIFVLVSDPVGLGLVASLKEPGGNATGFTNYEFDFGLKMLQLFLETAPQVKRVVAIANPETSVMAEFLEPMERASRSLGVALTAVPVHNETEIERALAEVAAAKGDGLLVLPDGFVVAYRERIVALAAQKRIPAIYPFPLFSASGGLLSYGIDTGDQFRQVADYVDRILRGAKPAQLPVQAPTKFTLVVNLRTAKALDIAIPQSIVARADEVIE